VSESSIVAAAQFQNWHFKIGIVEVAAETISAGEMRSCLSISIEKADGSLY
jgi:hypothetical protein